VTEIGVDFARLVEHQLASGAAVFHVDLCLDDPGVTTAIEALRGLGFLFCALLPEFAHTDVVRLQRLSAPVSTTFAPRLVNPTAQTLLAQMQAEHRLPSR
jgi:hypothetical protein